MAKGWHPGIGQHLAGVTAGERDGTPLAGFALVDPADPAEVEAVEVENLNGRRLRPHADHVAAPPRLNLLRAFQH